MGHPKKSKAYPAEFLTICEQAFNSQPDSPLVIQLPPDRKAASMRTSLQYFCKRVVEEGESPRASEEERRRSNWMAKIQVRADLLKNQVILENRDNSWLAVLARDALAGMGVDTPEQASLKRFQAALSNPDVTAMGLPGHQKKTPADQLAALRKVYGEDYNPDE